MFIINKYSTVYYQIIKRACNRGLDKKALPYYTESHHIIPRSLAGANTSNNLVLLTAKEHFVCHRLLVKMTVGHAHELMKHAFGFMCQTIHSTQFKRSQTSTAYQILRLHSAVRSPEWRAKIGAANKGKVRSAEYVVKMKARLTGRKLSSQAKENIRRGSILRGVSDNCRKARLATLVRAFAVTHPTGERETIINLKQWCTNNKVPHKTAAGNCNCSNPITRGLLMGFKFERISTQ